MSQKLSNIDLNLMVALDALLTEQSVTRAAERLLIGQSAMSSTLKRLRSLFDDPILVRQGRQLVPTPLAVSLVEPVREALSIIEAVVGVRTSFDPVKDARTFSICTSDYVTLVLLRPLIAHFYKIAPHVRLNVFPLPSDGYLDVLRRNQVDLVILPRDLLSGRPAYPHATLFTDQYKLAVDPANTLVGDSVTPEEFPRLPYLAYKLGSKPSIADEQLEAANIHRLVEVTTESFVLSPLLLIGTNLVTLLHERLARAMAPHLTLKLLDPPIALTQLVEIMVWTTPNETDPAHMWLRRELARMAAGLPNDEPSM